MNQFRTKIFCTQGLVFGVFFSNDSYCDILTSVSSVPLLGLSELSLTGRFAVEVQRAHITGRTFMRVWQHEEIKTPSHRTHILGTRKQLTGQRQLCLAER